ncbi:hypothetical protein ACQ4WX_35260 [Streptomyces lasalocidi]
MSEALQPGPTRLPHPPLQAPTRRSAPDRVPRPSGQSSARTATGAWPTRNCSAVPALGALAGLVQDTSREADRLHGKLRRHAAQVRDRLGDALNPHRDPAFVPVTGLLTSSGHATDLHAARFAQQMNQLALVLDSYQSAVRHIRSVTDRS